MFIATREEISWRSAKHRSYVQLYFARRAAARNEVIVAYEMKQISASFHLISRLSSSRPTRHFYESH
jgi:hypothetical protein